VRSIVVHLADLLSDAKVEAAVASQVQMQFMEVGGYQRQAIFQHPDALVRFTLPPMPGGGRLNFGCGIKTVSWERLGAPVRFRIGVAEAARRSPWSIGRRSRADDVSWLWESTLDPRGEIEDRRWIDAEVDLPEAGSLLLETTAESTNDAWAGWSDPRLELRIAPATIARRTRPPNHLLLISADALRADLVANPDVGTPYLDALAADGVRFEHARAASVSTAGSYASLLTGTDPPLHGLDSEWGTMPVGLPNLASELDRAGWHTVFAVSQHETARSGFAPSFAETLPCLGNPSQDGEVTTRAVLRRLDQESADPQLTWVHYFDTHPPRQMPSDLVRLYYEGDPRDPSRTWQAERLAGVHGVESLVAFAEAVPGLRAGMIDARLPFRLHATAARLAGDLEAGPDLASHVAGLGPEASLGLPMDQFAAWLAERAAELDRGEINPELIEWLEALTPRLKEIERQAIGWLDGVVDYRYALAQAPAAATHVDRQVGALIAFMREAGLYDAATIVFVSPHGELFGEQGHAFRHHALLEEVLRIPLIIKPAADAGIAPGTLGGVFDSIDLLPTLLELVEHDSPACEGTSRLAEMRDGRRIAPHESVSWNVHGLQACLARPPHKLVQTYGLLPSPDGSWTAPGTNEWRDLESDEPCLPPPDAAELERRLEELARVTV
jgi:hypothetical protein